MVVKFIKQKPPYNPGDYAVYPDGIAKKLIEDGFAEAFVIPTKQATVKANKMVDKPEESK